MNHPIEFVSLGPGEPELITLKGLKALQQADCIFCPATTTREGKQVSRATDIMQALDIPLSVIKPFHLPMSKERGGALAAYDQVYEEAKTRYGQQQRVVIVAEGDTGFYSSIQYIFEKLQTAGIPAQRIAGIPAFIAAGAVANLHIASQEERMIVAPGTLTAGEIEQYHREGTVVVIMKLSQCAHEVQQCMQLHPDYRYHYFENVGTEKEFYTHQLEELKERRFPYFSLIIIK